MKYSNKTQFLMIKNALNFIKIQTFYLLIIYEYKKILIDDRVKLF